MLETCYIAIRLYTRRANIINMVFLGVIYQPCRFEHYIDPFLHEVRLYIDALQNKYLNFITTKHHIENSMRFVYENIYDQQPRLLWATQLFPSFAFSYVYVKSGQRITDVCASKVV